MRASLPIDQLTAFATTASVGGTTETKIEDELTKIKLKRPTATFRSFAVELTVQLAAQFGVHVALQAAVQLALPLSPVFEPALGEQR